MRQVSPAKTFVDNEGFPRERTAEDKEPKHAEKDNESGELVREKVIALRRPPGHLVMSGLHSSSTRNLLQTPFPLVKEHQRFAGFRIQDFIRGPGSLKLREGSLRYRRGRRGSLVGPDFQTRVQLERGVPVSYTTSLKTTGQPRQGDLIKASRERQIFRVPIESLPPEHTEEPVRNPEAICVNIWEEFLYGRSVVGSRTGDDSQSQGLVGNLRACLGRYLSSSTIDMLLCLIYFFIYFATCLMYNIFWELGYTILFASHLQIHERAYEEKVEVEFTGSTFQGPAYIIVRNWCQHCIQKENEKVMFRLMKKMKADITGVQDS